MAESASCLPTVVASTSVVDAARRSFFRCSGGSVPLAIAQFALALVGLFLFLRAFPTAPGCAGESMCMAAVSFWITPPAFFWSGVSALATWRVNRLSDEKSHRGRGRLIAIAGAANLLLAPVCMCACLIWAHRALATHRTIHAALCAVSQAQAFTCARAATAIRRARGGSWCSMLSPSELLLYERIPTSLPAGIDLDSTPAELTQGMLTQTMLKRQRISKSLPRGWRFQHLSDGSLVFEHMRTGRMEWELPTITRQHSGCELAPPLRIPAPIRESKRETIGSSVPGQASGSASETDLSPDAKTAETEVWGSYLRRTQHGGRTRRPRLSDISWFDPQSDQAALIGDLARPPPPGTSPMPMRM